MLLLFVLCTIYELWVGGLYVQNKRVVVVVVVNNWFIIYQIRWCGRPCPSGQNRWHRNTCPLIAIGSNPSLTFDSFIWGRAIQLAYGTTVVLLRCPLVPERKCTKGHPRSFSTSESLKAAIWPWHWWCRWILNKSDTVTKIMEREINIVKK